MKKKGMFFNFNVKRLLIFGCTLFALFSNVYGGFLPSTPEKIHDISKSDKEDLEIRATIPLQQKKQITGVVLDEKGEPVIGANIIVKGVPSNGTVTDGEGKFRLDLAGNSVIHISYIGYLPQEIAIGEQTSLRIVLTENTKALDELIVIGYGTAKKSDLTGSIQRINVDIFKNQNMTQVTDMLSGTVAGLNVVQGTGAAGGGSLEIRGQTSLSASNAPIIVIDGSIYQGSLRDINPSDVATIDILKDASSSAIYGSRASNGIIMITTHKGKKGKPRITFSSQLGMTDPTNIFGPYDAKEFMTLRRDVMRGRNPGLASYYYDDPDNLPAGVTLEDWRNASSNPQADNTAEWLSRLNFFDMEVTNYKKGQSIDWRKEVMGSGSTQKYDIGVGGGTDNLSYFFGLDYQNNRGLIKGDDFSAVRTRLNFDFNITDWLNVGTNTQFSDRDESSVATEWGMMYYMSPYGDKYNEDGTLKWYPNYGTNENPLLNYEYTQKLRKVYSLFSTLYANVKLPLGLNYKISFQPHYEFIKDYRFWPSETPTGGRDHSGGYGTRADYSSFGWMLDNIVTWNKQIGAHNFAATFLYSKEKLNGWTTYLSNESFTPNEMLGYSGLQFGINPSVRTTDTETTGDALMARLNYSLLDRYLFTASIRRDGYSAFGAGNPRATFPAFALAWKISDEPFFNIPNVYQLKLRISWGKNGNREIGAYASLAQLASILHYNGTETQIGSYNLTMANRILAWEKTEALNVGLDLGLFENRIDLVVDAYLMKTHDLLMARRVPQITGYKNVTSNLGKIQNRGLEITLNTVNIDKPNFKWRSNVVFSLNRNKILELFGDYEEVEIDEKKVKRETPDYTNNWFPGQPIDVIWNYNIEGIWQENETEQAAVYSLSPGDWKATDVDDNKKYEALEDKMFIGYTQPRYRTGLRNEFDFLKNFTASFFLRAEVGHQAAFAQALHRTGVSYSVMNIWKFPYWTPENPINDYARLYTNTSVFGGGLMIYKPRTFWRLQDVSLSYNLPKNILSKVGIESAEIYYSGHNLLYFSKWPGWDPESLNTPMPRTHTIGFRLSM